MKRILFFIISILILIQIKAELTLPAIFSDNMVLQRETNVAICGKAAPNEKVTVL